MLRNPCFSAAVIGLSALGMSAHVFAEALPGVAYEHWVGHRYEFKLDDSSMMTEYAGETVSMSTYAFVLRVGFIPRFECEPLITLAVRPVSDDTAVDPNAIMPVEFRIDGADIELPISVDENDAAVNMYYSARVEQIAALRQQIDRGNLAYVRTAGGEVVVFSLFGSTRTLKALEARCRQHPPAPFDSE